MERTDESSEAAIREIVSQRMTAGFQTKNGALYASAFAPIHDYVPVNGELVSDLSREDNAQVHQAMFDGRERGATGNDLSTLESPAFEVQKIRFLTPEIAVVHLSGMVAGKAQTIGTAVFQKDGDWLIASFHNAPVLGPHG